MRVSVATALGAAAAHAKVLADQEEREMELLVASVIDQQVGCLVRTEDYLLCCVLTTVVLFFN